MRPSTSPRREPSASRQVMPLGPMSVPPFWNQMLRVAGPTGPAKGPSESPTAVAAMVSALLVAAPARSEEHTSELQSRQYLVCRLLLEKKKTKKETDKQRSQ